MESAVELAMETSRVDSGVRNQARTKLNQLELDNPAGTITISCKAKVRSEPADGFQQMKRRRAGESADEEKRKREANVVEENQQMSVTQLRLLCNLWSLGVLTAAGCGIGSVHAVVRSNLLVEPSEVEEGEISVSGALVILDVQEQRAIAAQVCIGSAQNFQWLSKQRLLIFLILISDQHLQNPRKDYDYGSMDLYTPSTMSLSAKTDIRSLIKRNGPNV
ncbi:cysteine protease [Dorcoceras hygrometricum]|uniref:Cysteine protease n=1 Tax=Dorcoceras hygrometricum TaxID=472368 RepID=A0A2Z7D4F9_9LAMI|nr:cysteine protease [Dorcoceras hygrometricum]